MSQDQPMLAELTAGTAASIVVTVTEDMTAAFGELGAVHPVYSTWNLVRHMEEASRKVILPYLAPGEDAVGYQVEVTHLAPTLVGQRVTVTARFVARDGRKLVCEVAARNARGLIGIGRTVQVLVDRAWLAERLAALAHADKP